jgi:glycosyltransferase involved in cell wall biosynthesis
MTGSTAIIVIGRNEGARLKRCLEAIPSGHTVVYVDSGSTDGSQDLALGFGADLVLLDPTQGFTAARARNAGLTKLKDSSTLVEFIQMIDGDCELDPAWLSIAAKTLIDQSELAVAFGRTRERFPDRSIYNRQCDDEWNVPTGYVDSCGGNAMFRASALLEVGGYTDDLIAGEEPDLCLRLQQEGWKIRCVAAEMVLHDADIRHFSQWWKRARRSGHAYAEHVWRNDRQAFPAWRRQVKSIIIWGFALPSVILACGIGAFVFDKLFGIPVLILGLLYPVQWFRIARRKTSGSQPRTVYATLIMIGKFAEISGMVRFYMNQLTGKASQIIEYKGPPA